MNVDRLINKMLNLRRLETLYSKIGPEKLRELVDSFYDIVFTDSSIRHLFDVANTDIREKQYLFLTQFLGGPVLYTEKYGSPQMRQRHLPHQIDEVARDEWLRCMRKAIDLSFEDKQLADALYQCFPQVASHMVNS